MSVVEAAPEASVCGALGCVERRPLYRVRHPSKGERVVCETHARRLAESIGRAQIPNEPTFKSGLSDESGSTGRTDSTLGVEETSGVSVHPEHGAASTMTAGDSSPPEGQDGDGVSEVEEAALRLFAKEAARLKEVSRDSLRKASTAADMRKFHREHLSNLYEARDELEELVEIGELLVEDALNVDELKEKAGGATDE